MAALFGTADCVGLGMIRSMSLPAPSSGKAGTLPLGISSVGDAAETDVNNATHVVVQQSRTPTSKETTQPPPSSLLSFELFIKIFAIGSNVLLQLSPMRLVTEFRLGQSTNGMSSFPLIALTACGFQWTFYGYFAFEVMDNPGFLMLVYANILGFVLGVYYLINFRIYEKISGEVTPLSRDPTLIGLSVLFLLEVFWCHLNSDVSLSLKISGGLSAVLSVLVSASPMVSIPKVLTERKLDSLPVDMVFASLASSVLWFICGYLLGDAWVWVPNISGIFLGFIQVGVIVHVAYPQLWDGICEVIERGIPMSSLSYRDGIFKKD